MSTAFNCCVQCQDFWVCKPRIENYEKIEMSPCCDGCSKFDICLIVTEKVRPDRQGVTR